MRKYLSIFLLSVLGLHAYSRSLYPVRDVTFVIAADTHFDLDPETDQYYHVLTMNKLPGTLVWPEGCPPSFVGDTLKRLDGMVIAGDIFDNPCSVSLNLYKQRYEPGSGEKRIHFPVYPGFGNHDINPASKDAVKNLVGRSFSLHYLDSVLKAKLLAKEILNLHASSRAYSWNVEDVHFVLTNTYAGDTTYSESNMKWLADDLKQYASKGNPVVYIQHYGVDKWALEWWPQNTRDQLFDLLDQYNLAAFFVGHSQEATIETYRGHSVYQVNNAWPDEDGNGSFAVMRIKGDTVGIMSCRWTDNKGNFELVSPKSKYTLNEKKVKRTE